VKLLCKDIHYKLQRSDMVLTRLPNRNAAKYTNLHLSYSQNLP